MRIYGYILIDGEKCLIEMNHLATRTALKQRSEGIEGVHLKKLQALLAKPSSHVFVDQLHAGGWVYVPLTM